MVDSCERKQASNEGYVHSIETAGTVDGPGIRFVVFLSGCPLRCQYCHNPDTQKKPQGQIRSAEDIISEALNYKDFMEKTGGGVTLTGGEPLYQPEFTKTLLKLCKANGLHTAVDTSGFVGNRVDNDILDATDLFLLDIKSFDPTIYQRITKHRLAPTLEFAELLSERKKSMWIRCVLVPNLNDDKDTFERLADYLTTLNTVKKVEILPFHKMGEKKWADLGLPYTLAETPVPSAEEVEKVRDIFKSRGFLTI